MSRPYRMARNAYSLLAIPLAILSTTAPLTAQAGGEDDTQAYFIGVADHFGLPDTELVILSEWGLPPDQVPVVLLLSRDGGIAADALVALNRGGQGWAGLARRYALDASRFHVVLQDGEARGPFVRVYKLYGATPKGQWAGLELSDEDVVNLINLAVLSGLLERPPGEVVRALDETGSWVRAYRTLVRSGG